jgi:hypothetical protein
MTLTPNDVRFREALDELAQAAQSTKCMPTARARELVERAIHLYHEVSFTYACGYDD